MKNRLIPILLLLLALLMVLPLAAFAEDTGTDTVIPGGADESDDLIWGYMTKSAMGGYGIQPFGMNTVLTGINKQIYDGMVPKLKNIAANGGSTVITVKYTASGTPNLVEILHALLGDLPYDLYWFDKTTTTKMDWGRGQATISFPVISRYRASGNVYRVNANVSGIGAAAQNVGIILAKHDEKADVAKLQAYRQEICDLVSYNRAAVKPSYTGGYGDPWQVIYVFDGDPTTNVVCEGYAKALKYLCDLSSWQSNVECLTVTGDCGGPHMWNVVRIGNTKYLADVTNCDTGTIGYPDELFLCSGKNTSTGYTAAGLEYTYDDVMFSVYKPADLRLSIQVAYVLNGGTNSSKNPTMYHYNGTVTLQKPTRTGYTFVGWYRDSAMTKAVTDGKITQTVANTANKKLTLYAKWKQAKYNISFKPNGGTGTMSDVKNISYFTEKTLPANRFTRKGYSFTGWNTKKDGSGTAFANKAKVKSLANSGTVNLYARWKKRIYTVNYVLKGGTNKTSNPETYTVTTSTTRLKSPIKKGYSFKGWFKDSALHKKITAIQKGSTGNKTFFAKWSRRKYTITYDLRGGTNNPKNPKQYTIASATITLQNPKRKGYSFTGWFDAATNEPVTEILKGSTGSRKLYAKWEKKVYSITYELNDGTNNPENRETYTVTTSFALKKPVRPGYVFKGWYKDAAFKKPVTGIKKGTVGNKVFYAKWKKK